MPEADPGQSRYLRNRCRAHVRDSLATGGRPIRLTRPSFLRPGQALTTLAAVWPNSSFLPASVTAGWGEDGSPLAQGPRVACPFPVPANQAPTVFNSSTVSL